MKYRKKPVVIEAFQLGYDEPPIWFLEAIEAEEVEVRIDVSKCSSIARIKARIRTLEGDMEAHEGDYIIKGVQGELYPCKEDIFKETYELAEEAVKPEQGICPNCGEILSTNSYHGDVILGDIKTCPACGVEFERSEEDE